MRWLVILMASIATAPAPPLPIDAEAPRAFVARERTQTISDYLHDSGGKHLSDVRAAMTALRANLGTSMVGKQILQGDTYRTVTDEIIAEWFAKPMAAMDESIALHEAEFQSLRAPSGANPMTLEQYSLRSYTRLSSAVAELWRLYLLEAGDKGVGVPAMLRASMRRVEDSASAEMRALTTEERLGADSRRRDAIHARYDAQRRSLFDAVCRAYRSLKERLSTRRETWSSVLWFWQDFAFNQIRAEGDAHDRGRHALRQRILKSFGTGVDGDIDFYMNFPGSPDRLITPYRNYDWCKAMPYPDIQVSDSPGLIKMNRFAEKRVEEFQSSTPSVRVAWVRAQGIPSGSLRARGHDEVVVPVPYADGVKLRAVVAANGFRSAADLAAPDLVASVSNIEGGGRAVTYPASSLKFTFNERGTGTLELDARATLGQLGTGLNANLLRIEVQAGVAGGSRAASSRDLAHVLRQKLILFLPGVCGSEISVRRSREVVLAFPRMSLNVVGEQPLTWLKCGTNGEPQGGAEAVRLDLFREYTLGPVGETVYAVENQPAVVEPPGHPSMTWNGRPMPHYLVHPWPYDWRLRPDKSVARLLTSAPRAAGEPVAAPYGTPPSMREVLDFYRSQHALLDPKAALVGHSTGGVIMKNLLARSGCEALVDQAFFVNTPFWGAPKAYFVFLTGDMGIPVLSSEIMRQLAPNMPIIYYLSPSEAYPAEVARLPDGSMVRRSPGQSVGGFMTPLMQHARAKGIYPRAGTIAPWNPSLEADARAFHLASAGEPRIGWDRCTVFWSDSGKGNTPGPVSIVTFTQTGVIDRRKVVSEVRSAGIAGDGTVPIASQQGEFAQHPSSLVKIASNPEHVPAPNVPFVWERIVAKVRGF